MVNKLILVTALLTISVNLYAQESGKNSFGISIGIGRPGSISFMGGGGIDGRTFEFGFNYYRQLTNKIKLETGLIRHQNQFKTTTDYPPFPSEHYDVGLLYVPVLMRFNFSKYIFVQVGPLIDIDLRTNPSISSQTGLGAGLGFGAEMPVSRKWIVQINPYVNLHSLIISKEDSSYPNPLVDGGIKIGIRTR